MGPRKLTALVLLLVASTALAGCTDGRGGLDAEEARALWKEAFSNADAFRHLDAVGIESTGRVDGEQVFRYSVKVRAGDAAFLVELSVAPRLTGGDGASPQAAQAAALLENLVFGQELRDDGVLYTVTPNLDGGLDLRRDHVPGDTAFTSFDDLNQEVSSGGTGPDLGPGFGLVGLNGQGDNVTIEAVEATTVAGRDAVRVAFTYSNATMEASGEMTFFRDPALPARAQVTIEPGPAADTANHPLLDVNGTAVLEVVFTYDDEVDVDLPADAEPAPPAIEFDETDLGHDDQISGRLSETHEQEVPLDEIELRVGPLKQGAGGPFSDPEVPDDDEIRFRMLASNGTRDGDDFTLTYDDADGDGLLSTNDTFRLDIKDEDDQGNVSLYWWDTWSRKYEFQPGFEGAAAVAGLAAAVALVAVVRAGRRRLR